MADIKKFLDQQGVSTLWGKIAAELSAEEAARTAAIAAAVKDEADRAKLAEQDLAGNISGLSELVGTLPEGTAATSVIEYVNKKTEGIATDAALGELQNSVNAIAADYLKAADKTELANAAKAADDKAGAAQNAVDTLAGKVGAVADGKTVVQMIADAQTAATYDDTKVKSDIADNAAAIALLNNNAETEGSVDYKIAHAVAAIMENPDETMNSINELVTWINDHAGDALELSNQVATNKSGIESLVALVGSEKVVDQITAAIAAALKIEGVDKYALATDLTAAIGRIAAVEADYLKTADKTELANAIALKADKTALDAVSAVANAAAVKTEVEAALALKASQADLEAEVTARGIAVKANTDAIAAIKNHASVHSFGDVMTEVNKKQDIIPANTYDAYGAAATALTNANSYTDNEINTRIVALTTAEIETAIANASK